MVSPPLLFAGVPGGIELLVVLLVIFLLFGVPLTVIFVLAYRYLKSATNLEETERLAELESEVAELRSQLESVETPSSQQPGTDGGGPSTGPEAGTDGGESPDGQDGGSR